MSRLNTNELLSEFYKEILIDYPYIDIYQLRDIINGPWILLKEEAKSGRLKGMRMHHFGIFKVFPKKAEAELKVLDKKLKEKKITQAQFDYLTEILTKFIENEKRDNS